MESERTVGKKMIRGARYIALVVVFIGLVSIAFGITFIVQGVSKDNVMREAMRLEKVTLGLSDEAKAAGDVVDTAGEAKAAQDILEEHLRESYGTYGDTEGGSPERTTYLDGTTLRNSLNLAVLGFGVTTVVIITGVFMILTGIALDVIGVTLFLLSRRASQVA